MWSIGMEFDESCGCSVSINQRSINLLTFDGNDVSENNAGFPERRLVIGLWLLNGVLLVIGLAFLFRCPFPILTEVARIEESWMDGG